MQECSSPRSKDWICSVRPHGVVKEENMNIQGLTDLIHQDQQGANGSAWGMMDKIGHRIVISFVSQISGEADSSPAIYSAKSLQLPQALVSQGMQTCPDVLD